MQNNLGSIDNSTLRRDIIYKPQRSIFSRLLPFLLLVSFVWLNFYDKMGEFNRVTLPMDDLSSYLLLSLLFAGAIEYLVFELLFFVYRFALGFSIYSFMIPKFVLIDKFRLWYLFRNILLGVIFNLRFFFPYIGTYLCVFELIFNFVFIICLYFDLSKNYVESLVGQFVFKSLAVPVILYEIYTVIVMMVGVL